MFDGFASVGDDDSHLGIVPGGRPPLPTVFFFPRPAVVTVDPTRWMARPGMELFLHHPFLPCLLRTMVLLQWIDNYEDNDNDKNRNHIVSILRRHPRRHRHLAILDWHRSFRKVFKP